MEDFDPYAWSNEPVELPDVVHYDAVPAAARGSIICEAIPGPNGTIRYVQDWSDLTHFG